MNVNANYLRYLFGGIAGSILTLGIIFAPGLIRSARENNNRISKLPLISYGAIAERLKNEDLKHIEEMPQKHVEEMPHLSGCAIKNCTIHLSK